LNYGANCTARDFQFGTLKISGRWIFVQRSVEACETMSLLSD